ncbi:MAG: hypothetical protein PVF97_07155 [Desulfobacterales bacterium]|jgi:hypothetical protein
MKIENGTQAPGLPDKPSRPANPAGDVTFKSHLQKALIRNEPGRHSSLPATATPSPGVVTPMFGAGINRHKVVQGLEDFLGALSIYQERLGDARFDLKLLEQDLNRLGAHCRQMDDWLQCASVDDDLRHVIQEGLTTARVEIERFYAGGYC